MIIAFTGKKGYGKTTAARMALSKLNSVLIYSFAKPLKAGVAAFFGFTEEQTNGELKDKVDERYGVTPRKVFQIFGTEIMQYEIYEHLPKLNVDKRMFWAERFEQEYKRLQRLGIKNFLIDDLRFPHEAKKIRQLGGYIVKIVREDLEKESEEHLSEQSIDEIEPDEVITSDGDLRTFQKKIDTLVRKIKNEIKHR